MALLVEYDGTGYGGSQYQANAQTVQGSLERALSSLTGEAITITLAGRTDAGVHAAGQVASFRTPSRLPVETFVRGSNALLPPDISVRAGADVPLSFDPRRDAFSRRYRYTFHFGRQRTARLRDFVWHVGPCLDLEAVSEAARHLVGRHDFAAFTRPAEARRRRTERSVPCAALTHEGLLAYLDIEADAFLQQMVRRIAGALVEVGAGRRTVGAFEALLREALPGTAAFVAPARGLCLIKVRYESGLFDDETDENI